MKKYAQNFNMMTRSIMAFMFLSMSLISLSCSDDDDNNGGKTDMNIVEVAQANPQLSNLVDAIVAAELTGPLSTGGPFTVFAPTNAAFAKLDPTTLNYILSTPSLLTSLLQYHVVSGKVTSGDLSNGPVPTLLSGQSIDIDLSGGMVTLNGSSKVSEADVEASNGVIHIIDEVLIPEDFTATSLAQIVAGSPDHTILLSALAKPELSGLLAAANDPTADLTVFAPTDAAFEAVLDALGKESIDDIPVGLLNEIVSYHILSGAVTSDQLSNGDVQTLLEGESVTVDITDGVKINNANVTTADLKAVNGVAHVVDAVLLPSYVSASLGTVSEYILFEKDFTILAGALRKAQLLNFVTTSENLTLFAPDNAGFVAAGITSLDDVTEETLTEVLGYHVVGGRVLSGDLPASGIVETLEGKIYLGYLNQSRVLINGLTEITAVDIEKSNGVIHVIDRTLVPPAPNVVEIALALADNGEASEFTVLTSLLSNEAYSDITQAIIDADNITVFAPNDAAFAEIADVIPTLTEDQISDILTYHAAGARVFSYDLVQGQNVITLNGQTLKVASISGEAITLEDSTDDAANVLEVNIHGSNGVIHVVDKVLLPEL